MKDAEERLNDLARMPDIHNSYGCLSPGTEQALELARFLSKLSDKFEMPVIVPNRAGDITVSFFRESVVLAAVARKVNWGGYAIVLFLNYSQEVLKEGVESRFLREFLEAS